MDELSEIVKNFINNEKINLIKKICCNEPLLVSKESELINKYVSSNDETNQPLKKLKISDEFDNMDFLNNDNQESQSISESQTTIDILDIDALNHKFKNMSLKEIQDLCLTKNIEIFKTSKSSGKSVKKTKKELMNILTSNP